MTSQARAHLKPISPLKTTFLPCRKSLSMRLSAQLTLRSLAYLALST